MVASGASSDRHPTNVRRRWLFNAPVCLAIGAIISIAVAIGCTLWWRPTSSRSTMDYIDIEAAEDWAGLPPGWSHSVKRPNTRCYAIVGGTGYGPVRSESISIVVEEDTEEKRSSPRVCGARIDRSGWPLRCLYCLTRWDERPVDLGGTGTRTSALIHGFSIPAWLYPVDTWRTFPTRVAVIPFLADTVIYAAAPFGLMLVFVELRRRRRSRNGLCLLCAYDLRGLPADASKCPECAAPISNQRLEPHPQSG